jgi:hypothetical protein
MSGSAGNYAPIYVTSARVLDDPAVTGSLQDLRALHHQFVVFEAFEAGLLATWETPAELVCVPRLVAI